MPYNQHSYDHLRELDMRRNRRKTGSSMASTYRDHQCRYPANTLGPQEDVLARRRARKRHATVIKAVPSQRNVLLDNIILLAVLAGSIWGLYTLTIYLLTHA